MKKLKKNQYGSWCTFCEPKTNKAVWRQDGFAGAFACDSHQSSLIDLEKQCSKRESRYTLADEMTWSVI